MIRMLVAVAAAALASLLAFSPGARGDTSIAAIVDHPDDYANTQVTVDGTVAAPSLGYRGESCNTLFGDERRTSEVSHAAAPAIRHPPAVPAEPGRPPPDDELQPPPAPLAT